MMWDSLLQLCFHTIIYFTHICSHIRAPKNRARARATLIRLFRQNWRVQIYSRSQQWVNNIC